VAWKREKVSVAGTVVEAMVKSIGGKPVAVELKEHPKRPCAIRIEGHPSFAAGKGELIGDFYKVPLLSPIVPLVPAKADAGEGES